MRDVIELKNGLLKALEVAGEGLTLSELEDMLSSGEALLWLGNRGVLVTILHDSPEGRFLHVWLGSGDKTELVSMEPGISAWARARGCHYASINGRRGWSRIFTKLGFEQVGEELIKYYE